MMLNKNAILLQHFLSAPVKLYMYVRTFYVVSSLSRSQGLSKEREHQKPIKNPRPYVRGVQEVHG